jgi:type IV secretory pathway VirB2 component (pilin)
MKERQLKMSSRRRKPLAALATVVTALAIAVPVGTASAATTSGPTVDPQVCQLLNFAEGPFGLTQFPVGGATLGNVLTQAGASVNCPAPAPQQSLFPTLPYQPTLP